MKRDKNRIATLKGEFVGIKRSGDHVTIWVEGRQDDNEPTVSGTALTRNGLDKLIQRAINIRDTWPK